MRSCWVNGRCSPVSGIEQVQAVRPGAEVDLGPFEEHGRRALAVAHDDAARHGGDGVFDHGRGDLHQVAVGDERAGLVQHLDGFRVIEPDAGAAQRLERGQVQILHLRLGEDGELRGVEGK